VASNLTSRSAVRQAALQLFDERPFEVDGFRFTARAVEPVGHPSADQWQGALTFAEACHQASDYWIGDLLAYAESRSDWQARIDQIKAVTGLAHQTLLNRTYISRHVGIEERSVSPSIGHSKIVAPMDASMQRVWLEKATLEGWTPSELEREVRASSRRKVVSGQAKLSGKYRVIYADPPWRYRNTAGTKGNSSVKEHYPDMSIEELCALPVEAHCEKNAVLFMWVTVPLMFENPGPREVMEAWGFRYQSLQTWDKVLGNPGRFLHITTEHLLIGERGNCPPDEAGLPKSLFTERRTGHSVKPTVTRKMIEMMFTTGPYLELFGRDLVKGWHVFGNDPKLWSGEGIDGVKATGKNAR